MEKSFFGGPKGIKVPEVGIYLRWSEYDVLARAYPFLKRQCDKMKNKKIKN